MHVPEILKQFLQTVPVNNLLQERFPREELVKAIRLLIGVSVAEFLTGKTVSYTDMQTDLIDLITECEEL